MLRADPTMELAVWIAEGQVVRVTDIPQLHALNRQQQHRLIKIFETSSGLNLPRQADRSVVYTDRLAELLVQALALKLPQPAAVAQILVKTGLTYPGPQVLSQAGLESEMAALKAAFHDLQRRAIHHPNQEEGQVINVNHTLRESVKVTQLTADNTELKKEIRQLKYQAKISEEHNRANKENFDFVIKHMYILFKFRTEMISKHPTQQRFSEEKVQWWRRR